MSNAVVFAYCSEMKEVLWFHEDEKDDEIPGHDLFGRMRDWVADGSVFTILEYHPNGTSDDFDKSARAIWWDDQLYNLGYPVHEGEGEYE